MATNWVLPACDPPQLCIQRLPSLVIALCGNLDAVDWAGLNGWWSLYGKWDWSRICLEVWCQFYSNYRRLAVWQSSTILGMISFYLQVWIMVDTLCVLNPSYFYVISEVWRKWLQEMIKTNIIFLPMLFMWIWQKKNLMYFGVTSARLSICPQRRVPWTLCSLDTSFRSAASLDDIARKWCDMFINANMHMSCHDFDYWEKNEFGQESAGYLPIKIKKIKSDYN